MIWNRVKGNASILMLVIIFSKLLGMARDVVLANYFGTSSVSDAYLIAVSVPTLLFYFIGHSLSTAYLPMYNKVKQEQGDAAAERYTNNLTCIALLLSTVIVVVLLAFPELVVKIFAAGFDSKTTKLAAGFIRSSACSLYFMSIVNIWGGYLQAGKNFLIPATISVPRNLVIMTSVVLAATVNIYWLGFGLLAAYVAEFLLLLPFVLKRGLRFSPCLDWNDASIRETLYMILPVLLGLSVSQINKVIDRSLASIAVEGGVSALTYASVLNNAVQEILVSGVVAILFANCTKWVASGEEEKVKTQLNKTLDTIILLVIPAALGIIVLSEEIVTVFLKRGSFGVSAVSITKDALCIYTLGLFFLAVRDILAKTFYAYKMTKLTTATSIAAIIINIVLNLALIKRLGINGLALATVLATVFQCAVLYLLFNIKVLKLNNKGLLKHMITSLLSSMIMAGFVHYARVRIVKIVTNSTMELICLILVGVTVYMLGITLLDRTWIKNSELLALFTKFKRREEG